MARFTTSTSEPFTAWVEREERILAEGVKAGVTASTEGLQLDLRQQVDAAGISGKIGNAIGAAVYPKGRPSLRAAGSVFARGESADQILTGLSTGATIRAKGGRYLVIPTGFNRAGGRRGGQVQVTPQQMASVPKRTFVQRSRSGALLWWLRVDRAPRAGETAGGRGRVGFDALVAGRRLRNRKSRELALGYGAVPMFILVPQVTIRKRLSPERVALAWAGRIPELIERALPNES